MNANVADLLECAVVVVGALIGWIAYLHYQVKAWKQNGPKK